MMNKDEWLIRPIEIIWDIVLTTGTNRVWDGLVKPRDNRNDKISNYPDD